MKKVNTNACNEMLNAKTLMTMPEIIPCNHIGWAGAENVLPAAKSASHTNQLPVNQYDSNWRPVLIIGNQTGDRPK